MSVNAILALLSFCLLLFMAVRAYSSRLNNRLNRWFSSILFLASAFMFAMMQMNMASQLEDALIWRRFYMLGFLGLGSIVHFILYLSVFQKWSLKPLLILLIYGLPLSFLLIEMVFAPEYATLERNAWGWQNGADTLPLWLVSLHIGYIIFCFTLCLLALVVSIVREKDSPSYQKRLYWTFLISIFLPGIVITFFSLANYWLYGNFISLEHLAIPLASVVSYIGLRQNPRLSLKPETISSAVLDQLPSLLFILDKEGTIMQVNRAVLEATGYPESHFLEASIFDFIPQEDSKKWQGKVDPLQLAIGAESQETHLLTAKGTRIPVLFLFNLLPHSWGRKDLILCQGTDLTSRKEHEKALKEANEALKASNVELERFAYVASHDLKEPLRTISSFIQLLEMKLGEQKDPETRQYMTFIKRGSKRMFDQVNGLLDYSRLGRMEVVLQRVNLNTMLEEILADMDWLISQNQAEVHLAKLPEVWAEPGMLRRLLLNLISNALKFHGAAPPRLDLSAKIEGKWTRISIRDEGIGIPSPYQAKIFGIFNKLHPEHLYEGLGMGLAVCKRIMDRHESRISVESQPGKGATFHIWFRSAHSLPKEEQREDVSTLLES
ncbi:MAG: ATP-binding protein [Bacteroidota bacterium]